MKLIVERSGGFAGAIRRGEEDGAALTAEQRADLQTLMSRGASPAPTGADRFVYKLVVEDESGARSLLVPETQMPASLAGIPLRQP